MDKIVDAALMEARRQELEGLESASLRESLNLGRGRSLSMPAFEKKAVIFDWTSTITDKWGLDQAVLSKHGSAPRGARDKSIEWPQEIRSWEPWPANRK